MRARFRFRPRSVLLLHGVGIAFVALLAVWLNWSASSRRVDALARQIDDLRKIVSESRSAVPVGAPGASSEPPAVASVSSPSVRSRSYARLLGSGSVRLASGRKLGYFDVRDALGDVRRYYVDPASPDDVRATLRLISSDLRDAEYNSDRNAISETPLE